MNLSAALRRDLAYRAREYAKAVDLRYCANYGEDQIPCFEPYDNGSCHGNFLSESYKAINKNPAWKRRLTKVHTQARRSLPITDRRWMELDSCTSSDALLMNIFCHPGVLREGKLAAGLGAEPHATPCFGYKAKVPLANGRFDRTEVDLRLGDLIIEAKLTENNFQSALKGLLLTYRDLAVVFDVDQLPIVNDRYLSYQLIRNILATHALECSFCVLVDARRPDLIDAWYGVLKCVKPIELRTRLRISTWQELALLTPPKLRLFLKTKYGISSGMGVSYLTRAAGSSFSFFD